MSSSDKKSEEVNITSRLLNLILDMSLEKKLEILKVIDRWEGKGVRGHNRKPLLIPIEYTAKHLSFRDVIKNISASGVFIETRMPFTVGQDIKMMFRLPRSRKLIQAVGEIVRSDSHGIGVKFKRQVIGETDNSEDQNKRRTEKRASVFGYVEGENSVLPMAASVESSAIR
jgi:Tfp pilus assembly protein PilZ